MDLLLYVCVVSCLPFSFDLCCFSDSWRSSKYRNEPRMEMVFFLPGLTAPSDNLLVFVFLCVAAVYLSLCKAAYADVPVTYLQPLGPARAGIEEGCRTMRKGFWRRYIRIETILVWVFQYHFCTTIVWSKYSDLKTSPGFWTHLLGVVFEVWAIIASWCHCMKKDMISPFQDFRDWPQTRCLGWRLSWRLGPAHRDCGEAWIR